jgi:signal transduction histidine kinase
MAGDYAMRRDALVDALIAVALGVLLVAEVASPAPGVAYDFRAPNAWAVLLALGVTLPLAVRRRWPLPVLAMTTAALFVLAAGGWNTGDGAFCQMIALYSVGSWARRPIAFSGLLITYAAMVGLVLARAPYFESPLAVVSFVAVTVAWAFGRGMRARRRARERAVAVAMEAESARAVAAERAMFGERLRIARELHDVVSHTLSVIAVQSAVARYQVGTTGPVGSALAAIEQSSRAALDDLRRMLGVLRARPDQEAQPAATVASQGREIDGGGVRESLVDVAIAVALAAFAVADAFVDDPSVVADPRPPSAGVVLLLLAASLPLAVRRRWPLPVLAVTSAAAFSLTVLGAAYDVASFCAYVALYTVATWRPFRIAALGLGVVALAEAGLLVLQPHGYDAATDLAGLGALIPWGLGLLVRRWREERRRALLRAQEAQRTTAVAAERAAYAERLRIAAELHDVVSHTLTAIAVQSGVARHALRTGSDADHPAATALTAVEEASRTALDDLRRMLGALGTEHDGGLRPAPGLAELSLLASAHRAAHGPIELSVDPDVQSTPDSLRLTAYRLVQEALTNVRKHAPGAAARVLVAATQDKVIVQVDDDGPGAATRGPGGYGLAGMRERVALFGGTLQAGPRDDGGFRVRAVLRAAGREAAA